MSIPLRIVFAGTPHFGVPALDALHHFGHEICAVYTQPDRPAGRGRKLQPSAIKEWALAHDSPVYQPVNFKSSQAIADLAALKPDVMVVVAYGLILPKAVLEIPRFGCVNVHASLLPRWRGASPIQHAIAHGDARSGVTIMQMDEGMDTGDMLQSIPCVISPQDTAATLHDRLASLTATPLLESLQQLAQKTARPIEQNDAHASYAPKIHKEHAKINWDLSVAQIDCNVRAYNPWPMAFTQHEGDSIKIVSGSVLSSQPAIDRPGTIVSLDKSGMSVACKDGCYKIEQLQFPGRKAMSVAQWLNGANHSLDIGTRFSY